MTRWPWIAGVLAVASAATPLGQDVLHGSFFSSEQITRTLSQLVLYIWIGVVIALVATEWLIRYLIDRKRKARMTSTTL